MARLKLVKGNGFPILNYWANKNSPKNRFRGFKITPNGSATQDTRTMCLAEAFCGGTVCSFTQKQNILCFSRDCPLACRVQYSHSTSRSHRQANAVPPVLRRNLMRPLGTQYACLCVAEPLCFTGVTQPLLSTYDDVINFFHWRKSPAGGLETLHC